MSYERSYSYLPVISSKTKRLLGYLTAEQLEKTSNSRPDGKVADHYIRFRKDVELPHKKFTVITPETPLEVLEEFFDSGEEFAVITDSQRKFVLGVATREDLSRFVLHRPTI